ncbi:MAG: hypothetical protein FWG08_01290 [Propionibacteriaceae bacterium]|jgi:molybdopterin molybdotransferase|nr:hypothetical protein [Propionibacteriaceae bacterium]
MAFFKRSEPETDLSDEVEEVQPTLPATAPAAVGGVRDFWQHWEYLLSMIGELGEFGVSILDSVGLTLNESIIADRAYPGGVQPGDVMIERGSQIEPRMVAMLTAMGLRKVMARPNPRVLVMALSQQAVPASYLAAAQAKQAGAQIHRVEVFSQNPADIVTAIEEQLVRSDFMVTVGGFDETPVDLRTIADRIGPSDFTEVAISPGGLHGFILAESKIPLVALPADSYSTFVLSRLLVEPMIAKLMGARVDPQLYGAQLAQPLKIVPKTLTCVPATVEDSVMRITGRPQGFEGLITIYQANALAVLASDDGLIAENTKAFYLPLS